jgi:hypothetical protein
MTIDVIYEDDSTLVLAKPAGLVVHSDGRTEEATLTSWLLKTYPYLKGVVGEMQIAREKMKAEIELAREKAFLEAGIAQSRAENDAAIKGMRAGGSLAA